MANIPLKSIKFPDLADTYTVPSNAGELPYDKSATYPADTVGKALQDKPDADGTIANAEQLTSNIYEEDSVPYNFRTSGGSIDIGDRETDMLVGGTVAWNQLVLDDNKDYSNGESTDTRTGFYLAIQTIASPITSLVVDIVSTAKKYTKVFKTGTSALTSGIRIKHNGSVRDLNVYQNSNLSFYPSHVYFYSADFIGVDVSTADGVSIKNNQLFDLTQMFGSTIADYIYSLETANTGAGVAWFRKLFPKPYYEYNAGELMSVNTSAHDTVGFNQLDPAKTKIGGAYNPTVGNTINLDSTGATYTGTNPIEINVTTSWYGCCLISEPLVAGQQYEVAFKTSAPTTADKRISQYLIDADNRVITNPYNWVGNAGDNITRTFTPTESGLRCAVTILSTSAQKITVTDPCIHLVWDGERDGEYEAYVKHSYPLDSDLTLRGIPKLDASNNLYYDGDTYESDGSVTRKYKELTITGSSIVLTSDVYENVRYAALTRPSAEYLSSLYKNAFHSKYGVGVVVYPFDDASSIGKMVVNASSNMWWFGFPKNVTLEQAQTALNGTVILAELTTPTTETADPYTNPQIVNDFGTEEYVDYPYSQGTRDVAIPVGHETQYMANLKAKLEMSPNSPEGAGDYIVRQTNGENEYVTLASNATIQNIIARLEALENAES